MSGLQSAKTRWLLVASGGLLLSLASFGASRHTLGPSGAYHVRTTDGITANAWASRNAHTYSRAIAGFYTTTEGSFNGTNLRGRLAGGASVVDFEQEDGYPCDIPGEINNATPAGTVLEDGHLYVVTEANTKIDASSTAGQSALIVDACATVVIFIPEGVTLTVLGGPSGGSSRACAGIRLPLGSTLVVCGEGALVITGGNGTTAAAPAGIGCGGGGASGGAAGIGGNGRLDSDADTSPTDMGKLFVLGSVSVTASPGTGSAAAGVGDPGLFCTSELIKPTLNVTGRSPDGHADTHWAIHYDVTIRDDDGSELLMSKATLSMYYDPISPPVREDMMFLGCTNSANKFVYGPLGYGQINPCMTPGAHDVYAVWIFGVNTTEDPEIKDIRFDDDIVSLREITYRIATEMRGRPLPCPFPVPISPVLAPPGDTRELVFTLRDEPLRPALGADTPIRIDGRFARDRPMFIDGGGSRTTPMFSVTNGMGLILNNVTIRNASGSVDGLAVQAATNTTSFVASNVLFTALKPTAGQSCIRADGRASCRRPGRRAPGSRSHWGRRAPTA